MKNIKAPIYYFFSILLGVTGCSNTQSNSSTNQVADDQHVNHTNQEHVATATQPSNVPAQQDPSSIVPPFTFYKVKSGMSFSNADIPKGKNTAFILFDPSCGHCQTEAAALGKNYEKVKNVNIYFVSMNDPALQASFLETFAKELVGKPNVEVLYDRNQDFIQKFHIPGQFPANYIYDKDMKLKSWWDGDRKIDKIIEAYTK